MIEKISQFIIAPVARLGISSPSLPQAALAYSAADVTFSCADILDEVNPSDAGKR